MFDPRKVRFLFAAEATVIGDVNVRTVTTVRKVRVICLGGGRLNPSPVDFLAHGLAKEGIESIVVKHLPTVGEWARHVLQANAVIVLSFGVTPRLIMYLGLAAALGRPVVRWWIGSDVLCTVTNQEEQGLAQLADKVVGANIAVADHLVVELALAGIAASSIPSFINNRLPDIKAGDGSCPQRVLIYLPTGRGNFYGEELMRRVIQSNPSLQFVIVGDENTARFGAFDNVESLGVVDDMYAVYQRIGCLLRITEHDGLPAMIIECLLLGKYAIFSWPLPGCWYARTLPEVQEKLGMFRRRCDLNSEGLRAVQKMLSPPPSQRFAGVIRKLTSQGSCLGRIVAGVVVVRVLVARAVRVKRAAGQGAEGM